MPINYKRYPPNWKTEIVPAVLFRAQNCCESCGLQNNGTVYSIKLKVKDENGRYNFRSVWFRSESDAIRENAHDRKIRKIRVVLTVAHLDHDEENWNVLLERLRAFCQLCHLRYDAKEKYQRSQKKWENG